MKKLDQVQYQQYWQAVHQRTQADLAAVCHPDKPIFFNKFFDRFQKYAIDSYIKREGVSLAGHSQLDIGCGRGRWLVYFQAKYGTIASGLDLSAEAVEKCVANGLQAYVASATDMPFTSNSFDLLTSITVLLHLPYDLKSKAIREIARVLKPGGKAILLETTYDDASPHVFGMPLSNWQALFEQHGMVLIHKSGHYFNLFRLNLPYRLPYRDYFSIYLDYPLEYILTRYYYGKETNRGLQHLMVFEKPSV